MTAGYNGIGLGQRKVYLAMTQTERENGHRRIDADERRVRKMARECFADSLMNATKWREFVQCVGSLHDEIGGYRVKLIDDEQVWEVDGILTPSPAYIESGTFGPVLSIAIEWIEVLPAKQSDNVTDSSHAVSDEVRRCLEAHHIPFIEEGGIVRVVGHLRA